MVHLLDMQGIVDAASLVAAHPAMAMPLTIALSLLGGFALRCALRSFAEIKRSEYSNVPGYFELAEAVAFFAALILYVPFSTLTQVGVAVWMVFAGRELGSVFTLCMRTYKAQPLRRSP